MSTPEDVAARLTECLDDEWAPLEGGLLRATVTSLLIRAAVAELTDQRATIERLERALTEIRAMDEKHRPMLQQCSVANLMGATARAALSPASAKTAEDR